MDGARRLAAAFATSSCPSCGAIHFIVAMVCAVAALRSFDYVMIMTLGGPYDSSTVLAYYMYEQTFLAHALRLRRGDRVGAAALMSAHHRGPALADAPPRAA